MEHTEEEKYIDDHHQHHYTCDKCRESINTLTHDHSNVHKRLYDEEEEQETKLEPKLATTHHEKDIKVDNTTATPSMTTTAATTSVVKREEEEEQEEEELEEEEECKQHSKPIPLSLAAAIEKANTNYGVQWTQPSKVLPADVIDIAHLLQLCGIPYVISPSEADAQCAYLAQAHLVDAVFSEDSDVLVHGAMTVLRGFFSSSQHAVEYRQAGLTTIGVTKRVLVALAMLLGCDYTNGIHGLGLVGALNAISVAWPIYESHNTHNKNNSITNSAGSSCSPHEEVSAVHALLTRWRELIKRPLTRWQDAEDNMSLLQFTLLQENYAHWASLKVYDQFPPRAAIEAFYFAQVDNDKTVFPRASPRWDALRVFAGTRGLLSSSWLSQKLQSAEKQFNKRAAERAKEMQRGTSLQHQRKLTEFGARTGVREK